MEWWGWLIVVIAVVGGFAVASFWAFLWLMCRINQEPEGFGDALDI